MSSSAVSVVSSATGDLNTLGASAAKSMEHCANGTLHRRQLRLPLSQPLSNPFRTHFFTPRFITKALSVAIEAQVTEGERYR